MPAESQIKFPHKNEGLDLYRLIDSYKGLSINHVTWSNVQGVRQKVTLGHADI